nr:ROK family transcriptional regulator [Planobispora longispora]
MLDVLRHVHLHPETTRAELARDLGLSRGSATEIVARLRALGLVEETAAEPTGTRGRPTRAVRRHDRGPVVAAVDVSYESWRLAVAHVGGEFEHLRLERHRGQGAEEVLSRISEALHEARTAFGTRLRAIGVSVSGTVSGSRLVESATLGWRDVDVAARLRVAPLPVVLGNDATMAGVAEARRGAATGADVALHIAIEVGVGGVVLEHGRAAVGSTGGAASSGTCPSATRTAPARAARADAGTWRSTGGRWPASSATRPRRPAQRRRRRAAAGREGDPAARAALEQVARNLGRGIGGLVNALDPRIVTLSGVAASIFDLAGDSVRTAYRSGLMRFRRHDPPPLIRAAFPQDGSLRGAAELAFDTVLSEAGLDSWRTDVRPAPEPG